MSMDRFLSPTSPQHNTLNTAREARILRDRQAAHEDALDRLARSSGGAARQLVQVYDGGAMPTTTPRVFFTHPVIAAGAETEGGSATLTADTATTTPVVFLAHVPAVGDYAVATAVGGRWVVDGGGSSGPANLTCSPCDIPEEDLTISWTNLSSGDGSATLAWNGFTGIFSAAWATGCVDGGIEFRLACTDGGIELQAIFFTSGVCPTGESNYCSNLRSSPLQLTLSSYTCSPFSLTFVVGEDACPTIYSFGNVQFVVTL
jgi:hypothetical protein